MADDAPIDHTFAEQLVAARRELNMRKSAYPRWVAIGKMTQHKADLELSLQAAIVRTLERLATKALLL